MTPILLLAFGMSGPCGRVLPPGAADCQPKGVPSVLISVTDSQGRPIGAATVAFRVNGSATSILVCDGNCVFLPIAFDAVGRFDVSVTAPGYLTVNRSVIVGSRDGCTPETEDLIAVMMPDRTVGALAGGWETQSLFGRVILRFGDAGEIIGAILFDRTIAGDGNFYISFNNRPIRGVPGQDIGAVTAADPTRTGDAFTFLSDVFGMPIGFEGAVFSPDFLTLTGVLAGNTVVYERLADVPEALRDP